MLYFIMSNGENNQWRAAFNKARLASGGRLETWWDNYMQVREFYFDNEQSYQGITKVLPFWTRWSGSIRKARSAGKLSNEQLKYLKEIDFPYQGLKNTPTPARPDSPISRALALHQKFNAGGLNKVQEATYRNLMRDMETKYKSGHLGDSTAQKLGIIPAN